MGNKTFGGVLGDGAFWPAFKPSSMGEGPYLKVPRGLEVLPRNVSTSPLVIIPRIPDPLILSMSVMLCSWRSLDTEGNRGLECVVGNICKCTSWDWDGCVTVSDGEGGLGTSFGGAVSSLGTSRLEMSSPSSASKAMVFPTGTFLVPSGVYV